MRSVVAEVSGRLPDASQTVRVMHNKIRLRMLKRSENANERSQEPNSSPRIFHHHHLFLFGMINGFTSFFFILGGLTGLGGQAGGGKGLLDEGGSDEEASLLFLSFPLELSEGLRPFLSAAEPVGLFDEGTSEKFAGCLD